MNEGVGLNVIKSGLALPNQLYNSLINLQEPLRATPLSEPFPGTVAQWVFLVFSYQAG
jgi:hypothetical protein